MSGCGPHAIVLTRSRSHARHSGFTLIELIMVMVLIGILAAFAAPRMFNGNDFDARGFHDETLAYLRYAQKTAIAQRRTVCVAFPSTAALTLQIAASANATDCSAPGTLTGPKGDSGATLTLAAKSGTTYATQPTNFNFDGLGQPLSATTGAAITSQPNLPAFSVVGITKTIIVEMGTGYVHD